MIAQSDESNDINLAETTHEYDDCLIYMVDSPAGIGIRCFPTTDDKAKTGRSFNYKDLVSVDKVVESSCIMQHGTPIETNKTHRTKAINNEKSDNKKILQNGPFVRLSDDSGWIFESKDGRQILKPVPVVNGLWTFYTYNPPQGHYPRWHPIDRDDMRMLKQESNSTGIKIEEDDYIVYWPTQKLHCDRRVIHPITNVCFYRIQGTRGWIYDRKPGYQIPFLLEQNQIRKGVFAYQNLKNTPLEVRAWPTIDDNARTGSLVSPFDIVVADIVIEVSHRQKVDRNGPFIHLVAGCGWLFQNKGSSKDILTRVPIEQGYWVFKVVSEVGVSLRGQPMIRSGNRSDARDPFFAHGSLLKCDRRIQSNNHNICFYRVMDTEGWIADMQNGMPNIEMLRNSPTLPVSEQTELIKTGWDPNFVRGISAVAIENGLEEVDFDPVHQMISFLGSNDTQINIFYVSRTVGVEIQDYVSGGRNQIFRRNCTATQLLEIMKEPESYATRSLDSKMKDGTKDCVMNTSAGPGFVVEEEEEIRNGLVSSTLVIQEERMKQVKMLKALKIFEERNRDEALKIKDEIETMRGNLKHVNNDGVHPIKYVVNSMISVPAQRQINLRSTPPSTSDSSTKVRVIHEQSKEAFACQVCRRVFHNMQYLNHHRREMHGLECKHCFRIFETLAQLKHHRESENHW